MRAILTICAVLLIFGGCSDDTTLEERFYECRELVSEKETRDASMDCWTEHSGEILENLIAQGKSSAGLLTYMDRYRKLLDFEEPVAPPEIHAKVAFLTVAKGRVRQTIVFHLENDQWKIDARELAGFWEPLDDGMAPR